MYNMPQHQPPKKAFATVVENHSKKSHFLARKFKYLPYKEICYFWHENSNETFLILFSNTVFLGCAISSLTDYETFFSRSKLFFLKAPSIRLLLMSFRTIALQKIELVLISGKTRIFQFQFRTPNFALFLLTTNIAEETKCPENSTHLKRRIKK